MAKRKRDRKSTPKTSTQPTPNPPETPAAPRGKAHARQVTVYDAVASRAGYEGFVKSTLRKNTLGEKHRRSQAAYPADEVLGRRKHAPEEPIPYGDDERQMGLPDSVRVLLVIRENS